MATSSFEEYETHDSAYLTQYDPSASGDVSTTIVEAVAAVAGTSVMEIDPLYGAIDPDALAAVVRSADRAVIEFDYHGYSVVVCSEGDIVVLDE